MDNCIFCKIIKGEVPADKIYEDDKFLAFLDITPVNLGHTLLIPKEHHKDLFEIPDDTLCEIGPVIKKIAIAVKEGTKADAINIGMNNGPVAGQVVFHAHIHIMPRFSNDGYKLWHGKDYDKNNSQKIAEEIRKLI